MPFDPAQRSRRSYCYDCLSLIKFIYYQILANALNSRHNLVLELTIPYSNLQDLRKDLHRTLDKMSVHETYLLCGSIPCRDSSGDPATAHQRIEVAFGAKGVNFSSWRLRGKTAFSGILS